MKFNQKFEKKIFLLKDKLFLKLHRTHVTKTDSSSKNNFLQKMSIQKIQLRLKKPSNQVSKLNDYYAKLCNCHAPYKVTNFCKITGYLFLKEILLCMRVCVRNLMAIQKENHTILPLCLTDP